MKKLLVLILIICMCLPLTSCFMYDITHPWMYTVTPEDVDCITVTRYPAVPIPGNMISVMITRDVEDITTFLKDLKETFMLPMIPLEGGGRSSTSITMKDGTVHSVGGAGYYVAARFLTYVYVNLPSIDADNAEIFYKFYFRTDSTAQVSEYDDGKAGANVGTVVLEELEFYYISDPSIYENAVPTHIIEHDRVTLYMINDTVFGIRRDYDGEMEYYELKEGSFTEFLENGTLSE